MALPNVLHKTCQHKLFESIFDVEHLNGLHYFSFQVFNTKKNNLRILRVLTGKASCPFDFVGPAPKPCWGLSRPRRRSVARPLPGAVERSPPKTRAFWFKSQTTGSFQTNLPFSGFSEMKNTNTENSQTHVPPFFSDLLWPFHPWTTYHLPDRPSFRLPRWCDPRGLADRARWWHPSPCRTSRSRSGCILGRCKSEKKETKQAVKWKKKGLITS